MPVSTVQLPHEPIIVVTTVAPFDPTKEMEATGRQFMELAQAIAGPIYRIIDISQWEMTFNDLVTVMAEDVRSGADSDPNIHSVLVGTSAMAALGSKSAQQQQYGGKHIPLFGSMDEALVYVRAELAKH